MNSSTLTVGLFASPRTGGQLAEAVFESVAFLGRPEAPAGVVATPNTAQNRIALAWQPVAGAASYIVSRAVSPGGPATTLATGISNPAYLDTTPASGLSYYIVVATNEVGDGPGSAAVAATFQSPLELWRQVHFGVTQATGNAANLADPDGDGAPNLVEYALGSLPTSAGSLPGHRHAMINERLTLTFNRVRSDVTYLVEASSDLAAWAVIATNPGTVSPSVPVTVELSTATPHRFLRLRITAP